MMSIYKGTLAALAALMLCLSMTACGQSSPASPEEPATEAATEEPTEPPTEAPTEPPTEPPTKAPTNPPPTNKDKVKVELTAITSKPQKYDDYYLSFDFDVTNDTPKDIKAIEGVAYFNNVFDKEIKSLACTISAVGKTDNDVFETGYIWHLRGEYGYDVNQFNAEDMALFNSDLSEIHFVFDVTGIAYADGSVESF